VKAGLYTVPKANKKRIIALAHFAAEFAAKLDAWGSNTRTQARKKA
jgi:ABC-type Fe3+-hydroxamate transport system substrate-binding protein